MKLILHERDEYILRFDRGDEVVEGLRRFCKEKEIYGAYFTGIGGAAEAVLSWYDVDKKSYEDKAINEKLEIASFAGNIGKLEDKVSLHAHGVFSDFACNTFAGHVKKLVVSGTCEIHLQVFENGIERAYDDDTGLNLMQ